MATTALLLQYLSDAYPTLGEMAAIGQEQQATLMAEVHRLRIELEESQAENKRLRARLRRQRQKKG
jgi:hypothetical protein